MADDPGRLTPSIYEIRIAGGLSPEWAAWFEGVQICTHFTAQGKAVTVLRGPMVDQSALFGTLNRIRDLGITLISVNKIISAFREEKS